MPRVVQCSAALSIECSWADCALNIYQLVRITPILEVLSLFQIYRLDYPVDVLPLIHTKVTFGADPSSCPIADDDTVCFTTEISLRDFGEKARVYDLRGKSLQESDKFLVTFLGKLLKLTQYLLEQFSSRNLGQSKNGDSHFGWRSSKAKLDNTCIIGPQPSTSGRLYKTQTTFAQVATKLTTQIFQDYKRLGYAYWSR